MKIWDISVTDDKNLPVWPGNPPVDIHRVNKIEDGANSNVSDINMGAHTGTHVDAPYHFLMDGAKVDTLPLDILIGPAAVIQVADTVNVLDRHVIESAGVPAGTTRLLFKTRNSTYWAKYGPEFQQNFVGIDESGAQALVERGIRLVGIDYLSIAPYKHSTPTHVALLSASIVVIEGLNLAAVQPGDYQLACLPLKLGGAEGAPARAVLMRND